MTEKFCPYLKNLTLYDCDFWCTCVKWWYLQKFFSFSKILIFGVFKGIKGKNDLKLPISVCFALFFRNCRSYHQDFDNDIYRCFSWFFFKKCNIVKIKIICFFMAHFNSFFNNYCFSSLSINAKKKFWGVPHLLHMCVVFYL